MDRKRPWSVSHLGRQRFSPDGNHQYALTVQFKPNPDTLPKANPYGETSGVYLWKHDGIPQLKSRIKAVGYVPEKGTQQNILEYFWRMRDA